MSTFSCQPTKLPFSHLFDAEGIDVRCGTQPGLTRVVHVLVLEHSIKPVAKCSFTKLSCKQRLICRGKCFDECSMLRPADHRPHERRLRGSPQSGPQSAHSLPGTFHQKDCGCMSQSRSWKALTRSNTTIRLSSGRSRHNATEPPCCTGFFHKYMLSALRCGELKCRPCAQRGKHSS